MSLVRIGLVRPSRGPSLLETDIDTAATGTARLCATRAKAVFLNDVETHAARNMKSFFDVA